MFSFSPGYEDINKILAPSTKISKALKDPQQKMASIESEREYRVNVISELDRLLDPEKYFSPNPEVYKTASAIAVKYLRELAR